MKAYDSWKNCEESVPQLVGEIKAMTTVKHSSRWYEIQGKNRRENSMVTNLSDRFGCTCLKGTRKHDAVA